MTPRDRSTLASLARDAAIVAGITLAMLVALEGGLRLFAPQRLEVTYLEGGSLGVPDEELGHLNRPGTRSAVRGPEFVAEYRVNERGFRDEAPHPEALPPGRRRILIVGDSFTFGVGSAYDRTWPVVLERELASRGHGADVVKTGVPAFDTRQEVLFLERLLPEYRPDVVVLAFVTHDLFTNFPIGGTPSRDNTWKTPEGEVRTKAKGIDLGLHSASLLKRLLFSSDALYVRMYARSPGGVAFRIPDGGEDAVGRQIDVTRDLLLRALASSRSSGASFAVLSIPQLFQVIVRARGLEIDGVDVERIDAAFARFAKERGFRWIETLPALAAAYAESREDLYFRVDGHLNDAGNRLVGTLAADGLRDLL